MIVNISLKPRPGKWDIHRGVPIAVKPNNDPKINATEKEVLNLFYDLKDKEIQITENNGPIPFAERVTEILKKHGFKAKVYNEYRDNVFYNKKDSLFINPNKPYYFFISEHREILKNFIEYYKKQNLNIEEPKTGVCGHYYRGKMLWTQIQNSYIFEQSNNKEFMKEYYKILQIITPYMEELLNKSNLKERITLRIVDYVNEENINSTLGSHIDMSYITAVLYEDNPGLHVRNFLNNEFKFKESKIVDVSNYMRAGMGILFSGNSYCDENQSWIPACWHGVFMNPDIKRRVSFLVRIENE
jgi:hypothetical protein